jgi:hypothetical protein
MNYPEFMRIYDNFKTRDPQPQKIEIEVTDYREVPIEFLTINFQAVIDAYKDWQTDIPGLKIWKEEP